MTACEEGFASVAVESDVGSNLASPSIFCHRREVWNWTFCSGVEPEKLHRMDAIATKISVDPQQSVFVEGDLAGFVFNVTRGIIKTSKTLPDGRRQIIDFLYPGDFRG